MGRVVCLVGIATANGQAAQQQRPQLAEEVFKNVQIIKGIPVDEFMDTMGMFAAATASIATLPIARKVGRTLPRRPRSSRQRDECC